MANIARWDPFNVAADIARFDPFEDSVFGMLPALFRPLGRRFAAGDARMDVAETEGAYHLAVDLPGVKKDDIQVSVYENNVTVTAEIPETVKEDNAGWLLRERLVGKFSRTVALPEAVDEGKAEAKYADGVLYLTLPKKASGKRLAIH